MCCPSRRLQIKAPPGPSAQGITVMFGCCHGVLKRRKDLEKSDSQGRCKTVDNGSAALLGLLRAEVHMLGMGCRVWQDLVWAGPAPLHIYVRGHVLRKPDPEIHNHIQGVSTNPDAAFSYALQPQVQVQVQVQVQGEGFTNTAT
ncbi:unnamed protein product [Lota lota]